MRCVHWDVSTDVDIHTIETMGKTKIIAIKAAIMKPKFQLCRAFITTDASVKLISTFNQFRWPLYNIKSKSLCFIYVSNE